MADTPTVNATKPAAPVTPTVTSTQAPTAVQPVATPKPAKVAAKVAEVAPITSKPVAPDTTVAQSASAPVAATDTAPKHDGGKKLGAPGSYTLPNGLKITTR